MEAINMIKERRSIRKYLDQKVDRETMKEIVKNARWAPSWANFQIARYTIIDDKKIIERIANEGVHGFSYNIGTLKNTPGIAVLSYVLGKSGKVSDSEYATAKGNDWEMFDAGIACQTFCLAAHEKGIGTCIFGIIDDKAISQIISLPINETAASIIAFGYPDETPKPSSRKDVEDIIRFI